MELSTGQLADLEQLKEKFKRTASQNLDEYTSKVVALFQQSKQCEEKGIQVYPCDLFTIQPFVLQTNSSASDVSPLNLVIEESTDSERPPASPYDNSVSQTKKRSIENGYSEMNGFDKNIKKLDPLVSSKLTKKLKTNFVETNIDDLTKSESEKSKSRNIEKYLQVVRRNPSSSDILENQTEKSKQEQQNKIKDFSTNSVVSYSPSLKKDEKNGQHKTKVLPPDDYSSQQVCKVQRFSKNNYVLQPQGEKFHKFSIVNLSCPIEGCSKVYMTQQEMNQHLNSPHPYNTSLYHCPINYCYKPFKNSNDLISHGELEHAYVREWICKKQSCNQVFDSVKAFVTHNYTTHHFGRFQCITCSFRGISRQMMLKHYASEHIPGARYRTEYSKCIFNCQDVRLFNKDQFDFHLLNEHGQHPYICMAFNCPRSFTTNADLAEHLDIEHGYITHWKCRYTNCISQPFDDAKSLFKHMYNCHYKGKFKCLANGCNFVSELRIGIKQHYEHEHGGQE